MLGTPGVSVLALGPVGRAVWAPLPCLGPCSLCPVHSSAPSCSPLSPPLPQPAVPRSPSKGLNWEHCWAGSSLPPGFSRSPSLHHVWPLPALDRPLHPCPEPSAGLIPVAPGGSHRAARQLPGCRVGGKPGQARGSYWARVIYSLIYSALHMSEQPGLAGHRALRGGYRQDTGTCSPGKGEAIGKASWKR